MRWVYGREARLVQAQESLIAVRADASVLVSEAKAALFRRIVPRCADQIHAVSNGIDIDFFGPQAGFEVHPPPFDTDKSTFVFTGTMDYWPNIDAVSWVAGAVLPLFRQTIGDAQFYIVGTNPSLAMPPQYRRTMF